MSKADCAITVSDIPDFVIVLWWTFVTVALLTATGAIIISVLGYLLEHYQDWRETYLRNKQRKLELELLEKQKDGIQS